MNDPNAAFLLMLAAAQQQQQQQQQLQQQQQVQKPKKNESPTSTSSTPSTSSSNGAGYPTEQEKMGAAMTPDAMLMWQSMLQAQLVQQMAAAQAAAAAQATAAANKKKQEEKEAAAAAAAAAQQQQQKAQMEMLIKKMMQQQQPAKSSTAKKESTSPQSAQSTSNALKNIVDNAMWQLVASQMIQQQQQQQTKIQEEKEKEALKKKKKEAEMKQQEQMLKLFMAQQMMKQQQQKIEQEHQKLLENGNGGDEEKKKAQIAEFQARVPLQFGWKRQTCVRMVTASGLRGDVIYYAPCGKKITTYAEVQRYLNKTGNSFLTRDNFFFNAKMIIGEFILPKSGGDEKEFIKLTEDEMTKELTKLLSMKIPQQARETTPSETARVEKKIEEKMEVEVEEEPEELLNENELNEDLLEDHIPQSFTEEHKSREPNEDLYVHEFRQLPDLSRIGNQCLDSAGFGDALMIHEFVQNFGSVLGMDMSKVMGIEGLCAGLAGDEKHADRFLWLVRTLLRLAMEFPGIDVEKQKTRFGEGAGDLGLDRENFSEIMRLFLDNRSGKGPQLAAYLNKSTFLVLSGEKKAEILAFICDELVCSKNVISEIDRHLEEISRLKGEKWMSEGKARALRSAAQIKRNGGGSTVDNVEEEIIDVGRPLTPPNEQKEKSKKVTPGLGQCEVLSREEESMTVEQMEHNIGELQNEAAQLNKKIHDTNLRIRSYPFGYDRYHRQYWILAHTPSIVIESIASGSKHNPACNVHEIAAKDPPPITPIEYVDDDVIACVEDLIDETILQRAKADKVLRKRYRRVDNKWKRGWWTIDSTKQLDALRTSLHGRGVRERCLHRLLTKPWFLNDLKYGSITLDPVEGLIDQSKIQNDSWHRIEAATNQLIKRIYMSDISKEPESQNGNVKPLVTPASMSLSQVVRDDIDWSTYDGKIEEIENREQIIERIAGIVDIVNTKFWRNGSEKKLEEWKEWIRGETTTSQLMAGLQILESMICWEKSPREALCQLCKSQDGDEMLVCDGCETGCHMECFRPVMKSVPNGDWYCPRCKEERNGKKICMFCSKEAKDKEPLYFCQRCALHTHLDCANDGPTNSKEPTDPDNYTCPNCIDVKTMRFVKPIIFRSESEDREIVDSSTKVEDSEDVENGKKRKASAMSLPIEQVTEMCGTILDDLEGQPAAGPFLEPVNLKAVPGYRKIITTPMDLSTVKKRNMNLQYETLDEFAADIQLIFDNCKTFNLDDSPVGQAGINLSKFFQRRWKQLKTSYTKRSKKQRLH